MKVMKVVIFAFNSSAFKKSKIITESYSKMKIKKVEMFPRLTSQIPILWKDGGVRKPGLKLWNVCSQSVC